MRYVAAYLLASIGGNESPTIADLQKVLGSVGIDCDEERAKMVISNLDGKNLEELIERGREKLASVPSGGGVAVAAASSADAGAGGAAAEEKKEEKKEESESEDEDMGFGLFD